MSFVPDGAIGVVWEIIHIINGTVDDWNQALPEAHQFLRDCRRFVAMIEPIQSQEGIRQNDNSTTATSSSTRLGGCITTATERTQIDYETGFTNNGNNNYTTTPLLLATPGTPIPHSSDSRPPPHGQKEQQHSSQQQHYQSPEQHQYHQDYTNTQYYEPQKPPTSDMTVIQNQDAAHLIITEILHSVQQAKVYVEEFLYQNSKKRATWMESVQWFVTRLFVNGDYRKFFIQESERIRALLNDLMLNEEIIQRTKGTKVEDFQGDMSKDSYMFWTKHIGEHLIVQWILFKDAYSSLYGTLEPADEHYVKSVLTSNATENPRITIYGFISFMGAHGFPFEKNVAQRKAFDAPVMGEDKRMEIAKMVMDLVQKFASPEMQKNLISVYTWYNCVKDKNDKNAMQKRADEWAKLVKEARPVGFVKNENHIRAEEVDKARRAVSLFYQEYMVMWRIGQISREMFTDVDFPGKNRIKDFIKFYLPLDKANFLIVIEGDENKWESKKPKVYGFLQKMVGK